MPRTLPPTMQPMVGGGGVHAQQTHNTHACLHKGAWDKGKGSRNQVSKTVSAPGVLGVWYGCGKERTGVVEWVGLRSLRWTAFI